MIAGFVDPSGGQIRLDGRDLSRVKAHDRGLGVVFQSYALFPHMTVAENVAFGLEMRRIGKAERRRRVEDILALVRLEGLADRLPRQLSGGQRQRVALARALVIEPPVLLLDEPLSNLDAKLREEMQLELRRIQRSVGITTVMVTHDQAEALALSDRVAVMHGGRLEQVGAPRDVYERPGTAFVSDFLGKTNILAARPVAGGAGGEVEIGGRRFTLPEKLNGQASADMVQVALRPEKIRFSPPDAAGNGDVEAVVRTRIYLGTHSLYEVESALGPLLVHCQNGAEEHAEGDEVRVAWDARDLRLIASKDAGHA